jgi:hypothetical protein
MAILSSLTSGTRELGGQFVGRSWDFQPLGHVFSLA